MGAPIPPEAIPTTVSAQEGFEVHPANWPAVTTFLACETQWRVASSMAGIFWLGLDYPAVDIVLQRRAVPDPDTVFIDLTVMENAALAVFSEARA